MKAIAKIGLPRLFSLRRLLAGGIVVILLSGSFGGSPTGANGRCFIGKHKDSKIRRLQTSGSIATSGYKGT